jgi:hypothetical protein
MPLLVLGVLVLAGCSRYEGPLEVRQKYQREGRIDQRGPGGRPLYSIEQQEERGRARSAMLEDDWRIGPRTYADRPDPIGRGAGLYPGVGQ